MLIKKHSFGGQTSVVETKDASSMTAIAEESTPHSAGVETSSSEIQTVLTGDVVPTVEQETSSSQTMMVDTSSVEAQTDAGSIYNVEEELISGQRAPESLLNTESQTDFSSMYLTSTTTQTALQTVAVESQTSYEPQSEDMVAAESQTAFTEVSSIESQTDILGGVISVDEMEELRNVMREEDAMHKQIIAAMEQNQDNLVREVSQSVILRDCA